MAKQVYFHIGVSRQAAFAIQAGFKRNAAALLERGWLFPKSGVIYNGHFNLVWEARADPKYSPKLGGFADLFREVEQAVQENILLSADEAASLSPSQVLALAERLRDHPVTILAYLEPQVIWLQQHWISLILNGRNWQDLDTWVKAYLLSNPLFSLDYDELLHTWAAAFGRENLRVRSVDAVSSNPLFDLLQVCGLEDLEGLAAPPPYRFPGGIKTVEIIRLLAQELAENNEEEGIQAMARQVRDYANQQKWAYLLPNPPGEELAAQLRAAYAASNQRVAQEYLGQAALFTAASQPRSEGTFDLAQVDGEEIEALRAYLAAERQPVTKTRTRAIVYQYEKTASTSLVNSLEQVSALRADQAHFMGENYLTQVLDVLLDPRLHPYYVWHLQAQLSLNIDLTRMVRAHQQGLEKETELVVLSVTREPLERWPSSVVQDLDVYLDSLPILAGVSADTPLDQALIEKAASQFRESVIAGLAYGGGLANPDFKQALYGGFLPELKARDERFGEAMRQHFRTFLIPYYWFTDAVEPLFDIRMADLDLGDEFYAQLEFDWGRYFIFRYEELTPGFRKVSDALGLGQLELVRENVSMAKPFASEVKAAFGSWKSDEELRQLTRCAFTEKFGYQ